MKPAISIRRLGGYAARSARPSSRFSINNALAKLKAKYPDISTPNLVASFLILHEFTAILPLFGFFALFEYSGLTLGESVASYFNQQTGRLHDWFIMGQEKVFRVGRRYGWFGYEKKTAAADGTRDEQIMLKATATVTNAIASYLVVKVLLPVRIGACIFLAPRFSNSIGSTFRSLGTRWQAKHSRS